MWMWSSGEQLSLEIQMWDHQWIDGIQSLAMSFSDTFKELERQHRYISEYLWKTQKFRNKFFNFKENCTLEVI